MAKVLSVNGDAVRCELNNGTVTEYDRRFFIWDVYPGDEFRFVRTEDNKAYIEKIERPKTHITLEDIEADTVNPVGFDEPVRSVPSFSKVQYQYPPEVYEDDEDDEDDYYEESYSITCPRCGSRNVNIETVQENLGSTTFSHTRGRSRNKGHGILWWLFIGWWWWFFDLFLWIFAFFPRLVIHLFAAPWKKRERIERSNTITRTRNHIQYIKICTCQNCGRSWKI